MRLHSNSSLPTPPTPPNYRVNCIDRHSIDAVSYLTFSEILNKVDRNRIVAAYNKSHLDDRQYDIQLYRDYQYLSW